MGVGIALRYEGVPQGVAAMLLVLELDGCSELGMPDCSMLQLLSAGDLPGSAKVYSVVTGFATDD